MDTAQTSTEDIGDRSQVHQLKGKHIFVLLVPDVEGQVEAQTDLATSQNLPMMEGNCEQLLVSQGEVKAQEITPSCSNLLIPLEVDDTEQVSQDCTVQSPTPSPDSISGSHSNDQAEDDLLVTPSTGEEFIMQTYSSSPNGIDKGKGICRGTYEA